MSTPNTRTWREDLADLIGMALLLLLFTSPVWGLVLLVGLTAGGAR